MTYLTPRMARDMMYNLRNTYGDMYIFVSFTEANNHAVVLVTRRDTGSQTMYHTMESLKQTFPYWYIGVQVQR